MIRSPQSTPLGGWLIVFVVTRVLGVLWDVLYLVLLLFASTLLAQSRPAVAREFAPDFGTEAVLAIVNIVAVAWGLSLLFNRSRRTPLFWSLFLVVSAALHLLAFLVQDGGITALLAAVFCAGWQVFWTHSNEVEQVFGSRGLATQ
jgi:hypothetical protein